MAETSLTGQDLFDLANARLLGYSNAIDPDVLMSYLNEGKDEVWAILKNIDSQYFMQSSQSTDSTQLNYFGPVNNTVRQFTLPADFREMYAVECSNLGFEQVVFSYKDLNDSDFREARRAASVDPTLTPTVDYFYSIIGKNQIVFAQFLEGGITRLTLWYVRAILDFEVSDSSPIDEIVLPYSKKISDYAVKKAMLGLQDQAQFQAWRQEWKDDIITIASSAGPRNQADPTFVRDFLG